MRVGSGDKASSAEPEHRRPSATGHPRGTARRAQKAAMESSTRSRGSTQPSRSLDPWGLVGTDMVAQIHGNILPNSAHVPQSGGNRSTTRPRQQPAPLRAGPRRPTAVIRAINKEKEPPRVPPLSRRGRRRFAGHKIHETFGGSLRTRAFRRHCLETPTTTARQDEGTEKGSLLRR